MRFLGSLQAVEWHRGVHHAEEHFGGAGSHLCDLAYGVLTLDADVVARCQLLGLLRCCCRDQGVCCGLSECADQCSQSVGLCLVLLALEFALLSAFDFGNFAGDGIVFLRHVEGFLFKFSQFAACLAGSLFVGLGFADFADGIFDFGIRFL